jgi:hypothetical protein
MSEDLRLRVRLQDEDRGPQLLERLRALRLQRDVVGRLGDRIAVSRDGADVFFYLETADQAKEVERLVDSDLRERGWEGEMELTRWHPVAESWEDPAEPLPRTEAEERGERADLMRRETEETAARGHAQWEVRMEFSGRTEAREFMQSLEAKGIPTVRRWKYVFLGARNEDEAYTLAEQMRARAPAGTEVTVEGTLAGLEDEVGGLPFAIFGP